MKHFLSIFIGLIGLFLIFNVHAMNPVVVVIKLQQAKSIYNELTGPSVDEEGAAGHLYRTGRNIVCKYVNADMDDTQGHPIPAKDARRYSCQVKFNNDGLALPTT